MPRTLPKELAASLESRNWTVPPIFSLIRKRGNIEITEMFRVFNMGIGMAIICSPQDVSDIRKALPESKVIGEVVKRTGEASVTIDGQCYRQVKAG